MRPWQGDPPLPSAAPHLYSGLLPRRCCAYLVDVFIIATFGVALAFGLSIVSALSFGLLSPLGIVVLTLWPLLYHSFFIAFRGATPGMRLFGLEVRDWSGKPVEPAQAVLFTVLFYVTVSLTAWLILVVAVFTERSRTLHDICANALVIRQQ